MSGADAPPRRERVAPTVAAELPELALWRLDVDAVPLMETGVPVWALDAATLEGALELRASAAGRLVLADARGDVAALLCDPGPPLAVTRRGALVSIQVAGVPAIHVGEALWLAGSVLTGA